MELVVIVTNCIKQGYASLELHVQTSTLNLHHPHVQKAESRFLKQLHFHIFCILPENDRQILLN